jgi:membrane-associated phospholipid phosphatase
MDQKLLFLINREWTSSALDRLMAIMSSAAFWAVPLGIAAILALVWGGFRARAFVILALLAFGFCDGVVGRVLKRSGATPTRTRRARNTRPQNRYKSPRSHRPAYASVFRPVKVKTSLGTGRDQEGRSFPSNHAANTAAVAMLAALFFRRWGWLAFGPSLLVAYSRVYVGSHWPSDVIVGICIGFAVACFVLAVSEWAWRRFGRRALPEIAERHPTLLPA